MVNTEFWYAEGGSRVEGIIADVKARDSGFHYLKYQRPGSLTLKGRNCFIKEEWYIKCSRLPNQSMKMFC
jgi:hypothetical protein